MKPPGFLLLLLVTAALLGGCSGAGDLGGNIDVSVGAKTSHKASQKASTPSATPPAEEGPEPTAGVASSGVAEDDEGRAGRFGGGSREGGDGLEADTLLAVRHGSHRGFERVVIDLGAGEEPAVAVPRWTIDGPEGGGLLRVNLPSTNATAVSDGGFGDGLLRGFHVVRAPEGGMFVDLLARETFRYRVLELVGPSRLVVDLRPTGARPKEPPPAEGGQTVILEPRPGAEISDPLTVSGYSRNFEAANTLVLEDEGGKTIAREIVLANDWSSTWGYFEATLDLPTLPEEGTLRVGAESARDGSFRGVEIPVEGR